MKSIQEILNLALESTLYVSREEYDLLDLPLDDNHSYYMCDILEELHYQGIITAQEFHDVTSEIIDYINSDSDNLGEVYSLESFLKEHSLPSTHEDKIKIYKNWNLRVINENIQRFKSCWY